MMPYMRNKSRFILPLVYGLFALHHVETESFTTTTYQRFTSLPKTTTTTTNVDVRTHHHNGHRGMFMSIPSPIDTLTSGLASIARLPYGVTVRTGIRPTDVDATTTSSSSSSSSSLPTLVQLYDVESSRSCRSVRELLTELDLVVKKVIPAAENSRIFEDPSDPYYISPSLKESFVLPRLVVLEHDTGKERILSGAEEITNYLTDAFSTSSKLDDEEGQLSSSIMSFVSDVTSYMPSLLRVGRGSQVCTAADSTRDRPSKPIILYSYEGNQFCRLVREVLTELDLVYGLRSAGKESPRRQELSTMTGGSSQCPFLIDANTDTQMSESADIIRYLYKTYGRWTPPNEFLQTVSKVVTPTLQPIYKFLAPKQAGFVSEETKAAYTSNIAKSKMEIESEITKDAVVVYTYSLSPFCSEATAVLDNLGIEYKEISLGKEWIPGLLSDPLKRAALGEMTGQTSLPHIFIGGTSIGGLYSGTPGLVPSLEDGSFFQMVEEQQTE